MSDPRTRVPRRQAPAPAGEDVPAPGVVGIGLAAVLTFALAQGSWQWFATFIGVTLLAVLLAFQRRARWTPDIRSAYMRGLIAYALVVGLCVAIALAPCSSARPGCSRCRARAASANCRAGTKP